jgi:hypothetical protein
MGMRKLSPKGKFVNKLIPGIGVDGCTQLKYIMPDVWSPGVFRTTVLICVRDGPIKSQVIAKNINTTNAQ